MNDVCSGNNVGGLLGPNKRDDWMTLRGDIETQTEGWLALANKCLQLIEGRSDCVNVIVTQTQVKIITDYSFVWEGIIKNYFYFVAVSCGSYENFALWPRSSVPRGECLLCYQNWKRFLFREDNAEVWKKVHIRCDRYELLSHFDQF